MMGGQWITLPHKATMLYFSFSFSGVKPGVRTPKCRRVKKTIQLISSPKQFGLKQLWEAVNYSMLKNYASAVDALVASVQALGALTRKAALELTFPISNSDLNPGLLTEITTSAKVERDRHLHNLRCLRIREAQKAQRESAGLTSATAKATELISHLLKDGLVENRAKIGLFIKAFVAGFCARQRLAAQHEDGRMNPTPLLRQHLLANARGKGTSAADTSIASTAFLRGFKESSSFSESGDQRTAPILMGIIDVSSCNAVEEASSAAANIELTAHTKAQQQLPLLINQAEKTLEEVDRALQMLSHALDLNHLKKIEPPFSVQASPTSKRVEDCRKRTAHFLAKLDNEIEEVVNERAQTLDEAADQALRKMSRTLSEDRRAESAAERATYEGQAIARASTLPQKSYLLTSTSAASTVASDAIIRAKNIGRQAKSFDGDLSARIEGALRHISLSPPRKQNPLMPPPLTPYQQALDKYHNGGKAAQLKIESNAALNSQTRVVQYADVVPPPSKIVSRELCPPPPPRISQSRSTEKVTNTSERSAASIGNHEPPEAAFFMATTAAFESRRQSSAVNREEKLRARDRGQAMLLATTKTTTTTRYSTVRRTSARIARAGGHKKQIWRGAGSTSSKHPLLEKQSELIPVSEERNKRNELAERSRARRRKKSGIIPAPPRSPNRPEQRTFIEHVEAAERLHRNTEDHKLQGNECADVISREDPLGTALRDLSRANLNRTAKTFSGRLRYLPIH